jgi:hypothetical protein
VEELKLNPRYELQLEVKARVWYQAIRSFTQGEKLNLMPYGNHARGAKFTDASQGYQSWKILSMKCLQIPGFFSEEWMDVQLLQN